MNNTSGFPHLFSPLTIGSMQLKNRAVMPAMGTGYANMDSTVSDRLIQYLARRAQGGTGLIITEVTAVNPRGKGFLNELGIWNDDFIKTLSKIPDAIHWEGGKVAIQLHHAGRETFPQAAGGMPEAPSAIPSVIFNQPCEMMSIERIHEVINDFADAAVRAQTAGFDSIELHGAHGYLLNQFLSPFSNQREDEYGGSEENRFRFVIEVIAATRNAVGPEYPVIIRITADELIKGGYTLESMVRLAPRLEEAGASAIHVSVGVYSSPGGPSIASMDTPAGFNLFRAHAIRDVVNVPVIGVGRIADPEIAEKAISEKDADLISFGRQHLADPDFINKIQLNDLSNIRPCVACNQGCIERMSLEMKSATCSFNPECGQEFRGAPTKVKKPLNVWVVGAGPAGLSAALAASKRGHVVEIFEQEDVPGGQMRSVSKPPNKEVFWSWVEWAVRQLNQSGVLIRHKNKVTQEMFAQGKPDAVIMATGAYPVTAPIPGIDSPHVSDAREVLMGKVEISGPAAILGAGYVGMETADFLLDKGIKTAVLEMQPLPPVGNYTSHGYWLHKRLKKGGGKLILGAKVTRITQDAVQFIKEDEEQTLSFTSVITAMGAQSDTQLSDVLGKLNIRHVIVGDAKSPRRILEAIHEGHRAGSEI
ncbi:MAG: FAD-dependent oxidoreductase [Desulfobacteraceae bacterium]|nr:FAD-dependent oxidoreductase [Desulfobacteraceae bacterium]MBC2758117.1 FAD-dependent oxidoreductase [Desulfobacteraceae bacterium]